MTVEKKKTMNTLEIDHILNAMLFSNGVHSKQQGSPAAEYLGVFAADQIPLEKIKLCNANFFVLNTDPSSQSGTHWVACFKHSYNSVSFLQSNIISNPENILEFFDSFAKSPNYYKFSFPPNLEIVKGHSQLQSNYSSVCGQYCIYFLFQRVCKARSFSSIISELLSNFRKRDCRDSYIAGFVSRMSRKSLLKRNISQNPFQLWNEVMSSAQASNLTSLPNQIQNCTSLKILSSTSFETDSDDE